MRTCGCVCIGCCDKYIIYTKKLRIFQIQNTLSIEQMKCKHHTYTPNTKTIEDLKAITTTTTAIATTKAKKSERKTKRKDKEKVRNKINFNTTHLLTLLTNVGQ